MLVSNKMPNRPVIILFITSLSYFLSVNRISCFSLLALALLHVAVIVCQTITVFYNKYSD